jgi:NitT/TauT family transport system substrate-binding protein
VHQKSILGLLVAAFILSSALLWNLSSISAQQPQNQSQIKIATDKLIGGLPLFVTLNQSLLNKQGISYSTDFYPTSSKVSQSMISGQYGVGGPVSLIDLIILEDKNPGKFKLFTIMTENHTKPTSNIIVKKDSPMSSISDLKGKKLAIGPGAVFDFLTKIMLKKLNLEGVQLVVIPPGSWIQALTSGQVDAVFSVEPFTTISKQNNVSKILYPGPQSAVIDPMPVVGLAFTSDFANKNPAITEKILEAFDQGTNYAKNNPDKAKMVLTKYVDLNNKTAQLVSLNEFYNSTELKKIEPKFQELADAMYKEGGYISKPINVTNILYKK